MQAKALIADGGTGIPRSGRDVRELLWLAAYTSSNGDQVENTTGAAPTSFAEFAQRTAAAWAVDEAG